MPTASGGTGAGGGVQPRELLEAWFPAPAVQCSLPPPQPKAAGSQVQMPRSPRWEDLPHGVDVCLGVGACVWHVCARVHSGVAAACTLSRFGNCIGTKGLKYWGSGPKRLHGPQPGPRRQRPLEGPGQAHRALESWGFTGPSRLRVWH